MLRKINKISDRRAPLIAQYMDLRDNLSFESGSELSPVLIDDEMSLASDQLKTPKAASIICSVDEDLNI